MSAPEIAVVIPTRERETRLRFALEALAEQTLDPARFEVVVVRAPDSRPPDASAPEGIAVRFLRGAVAGPAAQRNLGWRASSAPVVAFTDDDCRPESAWLERLLAAARPATVVQGPTEPDPDERHLLTGLARSVEISGPSGWYESCNIAYPRALLAELGGFDEVFETAWGEDTDLGLRARAAGADLRFEPGARVRHAVNGRSLRAAVREAWRRRWLALVIARHPEQRRGLTAGVFANRSHALAVLALAGLAASRRRPAALLATLAYPAVALGAFLRSVRAEPRRLARFALQLPLALCVDLAELAATVAGAIRWRTPLI